MPLGISGTFEPLDASYSVDLRDTVAAMLTTRAAARPSVQQLMARPAVRVRVPGLWVGG
jgi:hypothetical protein